MQCNHCGKKAATGHTSTSDRPRHERKGSQEADQPAGSSESIARAMERMMGIRNPRRWKYRIRPGRHACPPNFSPRTGGIGRRQAGADTHTWVAAGTPKKTYRRDELCGASSSSRPRRACEPWGPAPNPQGTHRADQWMMMMMRGRRQGTTSWPIVVDR
ncbi:hypothetical protein BDA96_01G440900 [Sorghum bicolor]|uniref:Uncharacterized protein n=1 Tax=Sorghum bicolor TaxID=4558 RepID=A0A921S6Z7_SORBI|nr:hypothetical protein BDA96_01G440900 [Sorghum bicolor]